jgi:uncharacterized OB-fold protein
MSSGFAESGSSIQSIARAAQVKYEGILYGLPCAHCGSYYAADLQSCPICHSPERVPAVPKR